MFLVSLTPLSRKSPLMDQFPFNLILPALGGLVWLLRLEGRINTHQSQITDVREDVKYIRERIDSALNGRRT